MTSSYIERLHERLALEAEHKKKLREESKKIVPKIKPGFKVGYCPKCFKWWKLEEIGQKRCPLHGLYLEDIHDNNFSIREESTWLKEKAEAEAVTT